MTTEPKENHTSLEGEHRNPHMCLYYVLGETGVNLTMSLTVAEVVCVKFSFQSEMDISEKQAGEGAS